MGQIYVSILGDSISTYQGYGLPGYAVYYQDYYRQVNELTSVYDTWWAKVNQSLHACICVDNAYSGSTAYRRCQTGYHPDLHGLQRLGLWGAGLGRVVAETECFLL